MRIWMGAALLGLLCWTALPATAQTQRVVRASGSAVVSAQPDQAKINAGVVTQAATAQEAAAINATQVEALLSQLRLAMGPAGQLKTIQYSLNPVYKRTGSEPPVLAGFTANNTVEITLNDLTLIGRIIDVASQNGASTVQGLRFSVKDPEPLRARALAQAARQARSHAEAIVAGLGGRVGGVLVAQEGSVIPVRELDARGLAAGAATPIEAGLVEVSATVSVEMEYLP